MISFTTIGLALIICGVLNYLKIALDVIKHTPKEERDDASPEAIFDNFTKNVSLEHIVFLSWLLESTQLFFGTGAILLIVGAMS